jgi:hypothetical protein
LLHGAAAANAEMRADRRDAFRTRLADAKEPAPVGMTSDLFNVDRLARQRTRNVNGARGAVGNAVAAMAEMCDHNLLNHAPPR